MFIKIKANFDSKKKWAYLNTDAVEGITPSIVCPGHVSFHMRCGKEFKCTEELFNKIKKLNVFSFVEIND